MEARREELLAHPCRRARRTSGLGIRRWAPGAWMEIEMAALLDFSAADFLGFFASRFDFLRPLAMAPSRVGEIQCNARPVSAGGSETT
jgi:hypothetical protein